MPSFSIESQRNLEGVHPQLVALCELAIGYFDFKVIDGVRTEEEQRANIARGVSWTKNSKHLIQPSGYSHAVDLAPTLVGKPIAWRDTDMFCVLAGVMFTLAFQQGIPIRWGGDWDGDKSTINERNRDYGHFELAI